MEPEHRSVAVERDEIIACPRCGENIAKVTRDIHRGEMIVAQMFEAVNGSPQIRMNSAAQCHKCYAFWFDGHRIFVGGRGWT